MFCGILLFFTIPIIQNCFKQFYLLNLVIIYLPTVDKNIAAYEKKTITLLPRGRYPKIKGYQ